MSDELNEKLAARESEFINEYQRERPHPKHGMSKVGVGVAAQLLVNWFPKPYDAGMMERGVAYGKYQNEHKPAGYEWEVAGVKLMSLGAEQIVMVFTTDGKLLRQTYIDQLVYNITAGEIEVWDFKTTAGAENKKDIDPDYFAQLTIEAHLLRRQLGLPYNMMCRLQIADPMNWNAVLFQSWRADPAVGEQIMADIATYEAFRTRDFDTITKAEWAKLIEKCSNRWKTGNFYYDPNSRRYRKTTFRVQCQRCDNWQKCMDKLGLAPNRADPGKYDQLLEDPKFFEGVKQGVVG